MTGEAAGHRLMRLLRLLELAGGSTATSTRQAGTVVSRAGRDHLFPPEIVESAVCAALVEVDGMVLRLTFAGLAKLRRMQFPETPFLGQHAPLEHRPVAGGAAALFDAGESPLARLYGKGRAGGAAYLNSAQFAAGERLRADFERGRLQPRVTASWERPMSGGGRPVAAELSDFAIDARRRVERALDCLEPELAGVVLDVCCFLKGLEQVERERCWPPRSAKLMLRTALSALGRHYGFEATAPARHRGLLHWGDDGYRPSLGGAPEGISAVRGRPAPRP